MQKQTLLPATLLSLAMAATSATSAAADQNSDLIAKGKYLTTAGDCVACHSAPGGKPFAGGLVMNTPFGAMVTPNITSDKATGIGNLSDDQFYRVMHEGIGPHGEYLYPVFPFTWYTRITRDDALAIKAYLFSVPTVSAHQVVNHLSFPFNVRESLVGWREIYFHEGTFTPDPSKSDKINRGAYLVEGLGHCAECHTPHNLAGASVTSKNLAGAVVDNWYAPNISSSPEEGIGSWTEDQLAQYLKTGVTPEKGIVAGPMAQVVHDSLSQLTDDDVHAIAAYLKQTPAKETYPQNVRPVSAVTPVPAGQAAYGTFCAACHRENGKGVVNAIPNLDGNGSVQAGGGEDVVRVVVGGLEAYGTYAAMPAVGVGMTDQQVADAINYTRTAWSNRAPANVGAGLVGQIRGQTTSMLNGGPCNSEDPTLADAKSGLPPLLQGMNEGNMILRIDQIVSTAKAALPHAPRADLVNKLIAAYCPVLKADDTVPAIRKPQQLGTFAGLAYGQLVAPGLAQK